MVGSIDDLDFFIEPITEKNTIPLHCWQAIPLSDIWIPSNLLANRNKGCSTKGTQGLYHTLQKKDVSKYSESFSVYVDSVIIKNEQKNVFFSDSNEDACNSVNIEEIKSPSDNLLLDSDDVTMHFSKSFHPSDENYCENVTNNAPFGRNDDNVFSSLKTSNINNLYNYDGQRNVKMSCLEKNPGKSYRGVDKDGNILVQNIEKIDSNGIHVNSASRGVLFDKFKDLNMQALKRFNKNSDSYFSLNEIINDASVTSLKDFVCDFECKKKEYDDSNVNDASDLKDYACDFQILKKDYDSSSVCGKQKSNSKKARKDKKGKKQEKSVPIESLFEDNDATQEYNCNRYMMNILHEKERCARIGDNPLVSKEEYPALASEELAFIHSDNTIEAENVKRQNYARIGDNFLCFENNLDLTPEEFAFINSDNLVKEENAKSTPTFSFIHSDKSTKECQLVPESEILNDLNKDKELSHDFICGKLVIENIPHDVAKDDIFSLLCGYGEIKDFSMISTRKFLKVFVEIDLICDIDWVIECLNGSEPFGTSTGVLKCYQQPE